MASLSGISSESLQRFVHLDMCGATEQTAIMMSLLQGKGIRGKGEGMRAPHAEKFEKVALRSILGFLHEAPCTGNIPAPFQFSASKDSWKQYGALQAAERRPEPEENVFDFVISPVDGTNALRHGRPGSASILAGGFKGTFDVDGNPDKYDKSRTYLVITLNPELGGEAVSKFVNEHKSPSSDDPFSIHDVLNDLIGFCAASAGKHVFEVPINSFYRDASSSRSDLEKIVDLQMHIRDKCRVRSHSGSRVMAAVSPFFEEMQIHAFASEVSAIQATLIAAAAQATGSGFLACSLSEEQHTVMDQQVFVGSERFLRNEHDVFFAATGITDAVITRGVRFLGSNQATTETILLRKESRTRRVMQTAHEKLHQRKFHVMWQKGQDSVNYGADLYEALKRALT